MRALAVEVGGGDLELVVVPGREAAEGEASHLRIASAVIDQLVDVAVLPGCVEPVACDGVPLELRAELRAPPRDRDRCFRGGGFDPVGRG